MIGYNRAPPRPKPLNRRWQSARAGRRGGGEL